MFLSNHISLFWSSVSVFLMIFNSIFLQSFETFVWFNVLYKSTITHFWILNYIQKWSNWLALQLLDVCHRTNLKRTSKSRNLTVSRHHLTSEPSWERGDDDYLVPLCKNKTARQFLVAINWLSKSSSSRLFLLRFCLVIMHIIQFTGRPELASRIRQSFRRLAHTHTPECSTLGGGCMCSWQLQDRRLLGWPKLSNLTFQIAF